MNEVGALHGTLKLDNKGFTSGLDQAKVSLSSFSTQAASMALGMVGAGSIAMAFQSVTSFVKESVSSFLNFEDRMAEVSTLLDTTKVNMAGLEAGVVKLSKKYGKDADGLAGALYQTVSAGISAADSIKFLEVATQAAVGGATDSKTAVDALTSALAAYGMKTERATEVSDSLFVAVKVGKVTLQEMSGTIGQVAAIAATVGVSLDELNSTIATLSLSGMGAAEAGTAMRGILTALLKPSEEAIKISQKLGIEFSTQAIKAKGFSGFLKDVAEKTQGSEKAMAGLFPEVRGLNGIMQLTSETGMKRYNDTMDEMATKTGTAEEATKKMSETTQTEWKKIGQAVADVKRVLGGFVVEVLEDAFKMLFLMGKAAGELFTDIKRLATGTSELDELMHKQNKTIEEADRLLVLLKKRYSEIDDSESKAAKATEAAIELVQQYIIAKSEEVETTEEGTGATDDNTASTNKNSSAVDKLVDSIKNEKDIAEALKEARQKEKDLLDVSLDIEESLHNTRIRNYEARIEQLDNEMNKASTLEREKLALTIKSSKLRQEQTDLEKDHAFRVLDIERKRKELEAGKDKRQLEEIEEWYLAKSDEINEDWGTRVTKELKITAEAKLKLDSSTFELLNKEVENNFRKWKDDLKMGSTSAWSGLISDTGNAIEQIARLFGGLPGAASVFVNDAINLISVGLSGNPVQTITAALKLVADQIFGAGANSKEAAKQEEMAAAKALDAARAFLKASGKTDLTLMSSTEIQQYQTDIGAQLLPLLQARFGQNAPTRAEDVLPWLQQDKFGLGPNAYAQMISAPEQFGTTDISPEMQNLVQTIMGAESFRTNILTGSNLPLTAGWAGSWRGAKDILDRQYANNQISFDEYKSGLSTQLERFKDQLPIGQYMDEKARIASLQPTVGMDQPLNIPTGVGTSAGGGAVGTGYSPTIALATSGDGPSNFFSSQNTRLNGLIDFYDAQLLIGAMTVKDYHTKMFAVAEEFKKMGSRVKQYPAIKAMFDKRHYEVRGKAIEAVNEYEKTNTTMSTSTSGRGGGSGLQLETNTPYQYTMANTGSGPAFITNLNSLISGLPKEPLIPSDMNISVAVDVTGLPAGTDPAAVAAISTAIGDGIKMRILSQGLNP